MRRWMGVFIAAFACVMAAGCGTKANDQDAIRASIEKRLTGRTDLKLGAMDREVKNITVNGDHATAQVEFRVKGGNAGMEIEYTLERQGKSWTVLNSQPVGMNNIHEGMGQMPSGSPDSGSQQVPQGRPPAK